MENTPDTQVKVGDIRTVLKLDSRPECKRLPYRLELWLCREVNDEGSGWSAIKGWGPDGRVLAYSDRPASFHKTLEAALKFRAKIILQRDIERTYRSIDAGLTSVTIIDEKEF